MKRVPTQRFEAELLDGSVSDLDLLDDNFRDMAAVNRLLGGNWAVIRRVAGWLAALPATYTPTILDVATGSADGPCDLRGWALRSGRRVRFLASDVDAHILRVARRRVDDAAIPLIQHDALAMPFADQSVDIVTSTLSLHHFVGETAVHLLREMARVARVGVIVNDLRRCWAGYWGARLLALGPFHELSKHDGPLSVLRAYTCAEAQHLLALAGTGGTACAEPLFRLSLVIDKVSNNAASRMTVHAAATEYEQLTFGITYGS